MLENEASAPRSNAERQRDYRARKKAKTEEGDAPLVVTDGDVMIAATIGDTLWSIAGPMFRLRALNEDQKAQLGTALAPLVVKYMPLLGQWQYEAAALLTVMALARETYVPKGVEETTDARSVRAATEGEEGEGDDEGE